MKITIEIDGSLIGYRFKDDNDNLVHFEDLSRREQISILNSFADGYTLFKSVLKDKGE